MPLSTPGFVITVGSSAGGLNAICELVSQLPEDMDAAVLIVLHLAKVGMGEFLVHRLQKNTSYTCKIATNNEAIKLGYIYVAPPDQHLVLKDGHLITSNGPTENRWRPSINVLFRSVAAGFGNHAIGIILTGYLDDGTSGMGAIKRCGGYCIVQDPNEAEYPDMPLNVLESLEVDYCVRLQDMAACLKEIMANAPPKTITKQNDVIKETEIAASSITHIEDVAEIGTHTIYQCPDCGGGLWLVNQDKNIRFRCHIGHSYSEKDLLLKQAESLEATLWVALRMMEERRVLLKRLSESAANKGLSKLGLSHNQRALELEEHIEKLKDVLFKTKKD